MEAAAHAARDRLGIEVAWDVQPLSGFEHGLTAEVARRYDLIVFDHPFCGAVATGGFMQPLEAVLPGLRDEDFAGGSLDSYRYAGHLWALPVDGATQAAVFRPDLMAGKPLPESWAGVLELGRALRTEGRWLGLATAAPHGVLLLLALCANSGAPLSQDPWATSFNVQAVREAAILLREAVALSRPDGVRMNAIDLHEAMVAGDDIAYCPGAYVYLTYAEADQRRPLRFAAFPGPSGLLHGTVLGGTGLGVTRTCRNAAGAFRFLAMLAKWPAQRDLIMRCHGQPGRAEAWTGAAEDAVFAGSHAAVAGTLTTAWTRPRFPGFIRWQAAAGAAVESFLRDEMDDRALAASLEALWREHAPQTPT
jgi:multiple sugar transport system substrate-binding protein